MKNFEANGFQGHFTHAFVGAASSVDPCGHETVCMDNFIPKHGLEKIAILHTDIQGYELEMLKGSQRVLDRISYLFISTHSELLHAGCEGFLNERGFVTLASVRPRDSYSIDGVLLCCAKDAKTIPALHLSQKTLD